MSMSSFTKKTEKPAGGRKSLLRKRASRLAAAQALYADAMMAASDSTAEGLVAHILASWSDSKLNDAHDLPHDIQPEVALLTKLIESALTHRKEIESAVDACILEGWKKSRMSEPLLATLRAFAAEVLAQPDRAPAVLTREYTEVAAQLLSDDELNYAHKAFNLMVQQLRAA